jgi:aspartate kinase
MIVMKFGGTSVKNGEAVDRVSGIIASRIKLNPVIVVSATGKTTDDLVDILDLLDEGKGGALEIYKKIEDAHRSLIKEVVTDPKEQKIAEEKIAAELERLAQMIEAMERLGDVSLRSRDAVLSIGERMSAPILAASLASRGIEAVNVDPKDIIVTDDNYGQAALDFEATKKQCQSIIVKLAGENRVPVIGGFVGATPKGVITTLGRGGSDLTASVIAKSIFATALEFWKDVDGILTADPRIVENAKPIEQITFREAAELTFLGSGVLHPASIQPAVEAGIPVRVLNSYKPDSKGTEIKKVKPEGMYLSSEDDAGLAVASIAYKRNQALINVYSTRMMGASGFLRKVFEVFDRLNISVDHIATSEVNVTVTVNDSDKVETLQKELAEVAKVDVVHNIGIVSVVGELLCTTSGVAAKIFAALKDINIIFITHGGASTNVSVVVDDKEVDNAIRCLHRELFR